MPFSRTVAPRLRGTVALALLGLSAASCSKDNAVDASTHSDVCEQDFQDCNKDTADGCETNTTSNAKHCGECGAACDATHGEPSCVDGACRIACDAGFEDCNARVADGCETGLGTDAQNCGACGNACAVGATCVSGACKCPPGHGVCSGFCTDLATIDDCGDCGVRCEAPSSVGSCVQGSCTIASCTGGKLDCNAKPSDGCESDPESDGQNCGTCGQTCDAPGTTGKCLAGLCDEQCAQGFHDCSGVCVSDVRPESCGSSCTPCAAPDHGEATCQGGVCGFSCPSPYTKCNDSCVLLATDPNHCGSCDHACIFAGCNSGVCAPGILATGESYPRQITVGEDYVFWINQGSNTVRKIKKDGSGAAQDALVPASGIERMVAVGSRLVYSPVSDTAGVFALDDEALGAAAGQELLAGGRITSWTTSGDEVFALLASTSCSCTSTVGGNLACDPLYGGALAAGEACRDGTQRPGGTAGGVMRVKIDGSSPAASTVVFGTVGRSMIVAGGDHACWWAEYVNGMYPKQAEPTYCAPLGGTATQVLEFKYTGETYPPKSLFDVDATDIYSQDEDTLMRRLWTGGAVQTFSDLDAPLGATCTFLSPRHKPWIASVQSSQGVEIVRIDATGATAVAASFPASGTVSADTDGTGVYVADRGNGEIRRYQIQ